MPFIDIAAQVTDLLLTPLVALGAVTLKFVRRVGIQRMPLSRRILEKVGVFPIRNHYYEPLFQTRALAKSLSEDRDLKGIDLNIAEQLQLLERFHFNQELEQIPLEQPPQNDFSRFYFHNRSFESGDAEYLYNIIRLFKPARIIEIGSGFSTLLASEAIQRTMQDDPAYTCQHSCIEPYENAWLEQANRRVIRQVVEHVDKDLFRTLGENDILFIDSSHMIRPQGDVLCEFLEILPLLNPGVLVHVHDIFTPKDYPDRWIKDQVLFWNEQYLLEGFLSFNHDFKVIGALNHLANHYQQQLASKCPIYARESSVRQPGSFWMQRVSPAAPSDR